LYYHFFYKKTKELKFIISCTVDHGQITKCNTCQKKAYLHVVRCGYG